MHSVADTTLSTAPNKHDVMTGVYSASLGKIIVESFNKVA